jgi:ribosomal protein S18 acetylase RimI-like enzyme
VLGDPWGVLPVVHDVARSEGAVQMKILVFPPQSELAAATAELGYAPIATRMRLAIADRPGERVVSLEPLTGDAATAFSRQLVASYAADLLANGTTTDPEVARETARQQTDEALAEPGSIVLAARTGGERVGTLWLDIDGHETFVLDVVVPPEHRGRGYGRALMVATEDVARERGCETVALSVFGDNAVARHLYDSLGYAVTETFLGVEL